ncbi:hypothetical protein KC345_g11051, partial [Hortaea werneckii]
MNKVLGKQGVKLALLLMAAVLVVAGCSSNGGSKKGSNVSIEDRYTVDPETPAWQLDKKEEATDLT